MVRRDLDAIPPVKTPEQLDAFLKTPEGKKILAQINQQKLIMQSIIEENEELEAFQNAIRLAARRALASARLHYPKHTRRPTTPPQNSIRSAYEQSRLMYQPPTQAELDLNHQAVNDFPPLAPS